MAINATLLAARRGRRASDATAGAVLGMLLLLAVAVFGCLLVGTRSSDIGTDTHTYAGFFEGLNQPPSDTRMEPGFVYLSYALRQLGLGVIGYQITLFALLLLTVLISTRNYFAYLSDENADANIRPALRDYLTFASASLMLLFVSPMFVNASINAVRQGLAALLVFTSLLSFHRHRWWSFAFYGAVASSLHFSSLLYLAFAPALLLNARILRLLAAGAFLMYVSGASMTMVRSTAPWLYNMVMEYTINPYYRVGIRVDFAAFSIFWYALPHMLSPLVSARYRDKIKDSTAIYLVMMLPFFAIGWGYFSNRYLLPAWLAVSLILAAIVCNNRISILRHPLLIRLGLIAACAVFYFFVTRGIVI